MSEKFTFPNTPEYREAGVQKIKESLRDTYKDSSDEVKKEVENYCNYLEKFATRNHGSFISLVDFEGNIKELCPTMIIGFGNEIKNHQAGKMRLASLLLLVASHLSPESKFVHEFEDDGKAYHCVVKGGKFE